ncbi:zinc finger protein 568-like [Sabethes cyaneus]|uniref:zinc finger protein 568-like n=1 Tax=Sabethes cyaneus TaxID=53552 RepID=UPI00237EA230|nr:zinc finger protein 568-like [Sabethes cyaneus]
MPASCTVPDCELKYAHSEDVSYHKYPLRKPELLAKWIKFAGRNPEWEPTKWSTICSRHFKASDFKDCIYRKNLISTAIPSIRIRKSTNILVKCGSEKIEADKQQPDTSPEQGEIPETETDQEELSGGEDTQLLDMTCRLCGTVFNKWCQSLLSEFGMHATLITKCLPFVSLELMPYPSKVCGSCLKVLNSFSTFYDNVAKVQGDLEQKYTGISELPTDKPVPDVPSRTMKIKQEPLINIKEETVDNNATKARETESSLIIKNPNITNDKNKLLLFNTLTNEGQITKQTRESKNCEILEIVNLYPPIVDITSATIREVQPYEITLPSSLPNPTCQTVAPQIINLKTENTAELEENFEEYSGYYQDFIAGFTAWEEHSYSKLPIQADDNKDELFPSHMELAPLEPINLGNSATVRVIHVELPPLQPVIPSLPCLRCHRQNFHSRVKLLRHQIFHCPFRINRSYRCLNCQQKFCTWHERRTHVPVCRRRLLKQQLRLDKAKRAQENRKAQRQDRSSTTGRFDCTMCDRSYTRLYNLNRHKASHRPVDQWNHKCGVCQKIFDKLFDLKKHFQLAKCTGSNGSGFSMPKPDENTTGDVVSLQSGAVTSDRLLYVCSTCAKQFKSYNSLKVHESVHTGLKVFICETCGKRFGGQVNLSQHRLTHVDEKRFACKLCPKVFKRSGGLGQHVKAFHMKIKPYQCAVCRRDFALKADMIRCRHSKLKDFG